MSPEGAHERVVAWSGERDSGPSDNMPRMYGGQTNTEERASDNHKGPGKRLERTSVSMQS